MARGLGTATTIIIFMVIIVGGISAVDLYRDYHMRENGEECGFSRRDGVSMECKCAGTMCDTGSIMNPMFKKAGEVNYYCYGECVRCICYQSVYDRSIRNFTKTAINCTNIS